MLLNWERTAWIILKYISRTDAFLPDMPIVYASEAFLKLTGYGGHEVLGQNCRLLSGTDTDTKTQFQIKECVRTQQACTVRIRNYRKDGTSFWNFLHISPVQSASGKILEECGFFDGLIRLMEGDNTDPINIRNPGVLTMLELAETVKEVHIKSTF